LGGRNDIWPSKKPIPLITRSSLPEGMEEEEEEDPRELADPCSPGKTAVKQK